MTKKQRRDYGSGSIYQVCAVQHGCPDLPPRVAGAPKPVRAEHKCRAPWAGAANVGWTANGTRRRVMVKGDTEAEAKRRLRQRLNALDEGRGVTGSTSTTVKSWIDTWLPIHERTAAPTTHNNALSAAKQWIVPTIGHRRLIDLAPTDIRAVAGAQREAGRTSSTQRRTHSVLNQALKAAVDEGHGVPKLVLDLAAPAVSVSDRDAMTVDQAVKVLEVAAQRGDGSRWLAALIQGIRQGEANGLTWDAIDFERRTITISWQMKPLSYKVLRDRKSGFRTPDGYESVHVRDRWHLVRPKSKAGWRVIPLVSWMETALKQRRDRGEETPHGIVWHHPVGDCNKLDDAAWYALQAEAGVAHPTRLRADGTPAPFTIHEARHSTATLLLEAGADPAVIIAILGHSTILTSRGYMHARSDSLRGALEAVAARLTPGDTPTP